MAPEDRRPRWINHRELTMAWTKPDFCDIRFGFEITMYIANR
jgi:pyrroloquinoline quinone biosynthesis protein A